MSTVVMEEEREDLEILRRFQVPEEDVRARGRTMGRYRWFRSANVRCIEHFRGGHTLDQQAGQFGWQTPGEPKTARGVGRP